MHGLEGKVELLKSETDRNQRLCSDLHGQTSVLHAERAYKDLENKKLLEENEDRLSYNGFSAENIFNNDSKTQFYTGLPKYALLFTLFGLLKDDRVYSDRSYRLMDEFFFVLVRLGLNLPSRDIAYRLNISEAMFSTILHKWMDVMYFNMKHFIQWPHTETLRDNLPAAFKKHYSKAVCIALNFFLENTLIISKGCNITIKSTILQMY